MVPPTDISELRRVLGLFVVSRKYIRDFACLTKPLTDVLKGKLPLFRWGKEQQDSYVSESRQYAYGSYVA